MIETFVRRHVLTTVLVLIAIILGVLSYSGLGVRRFPKIDFPVVTITTVYPGGSPAEIETEITKRVEDAVSSISGIDSIKSYSQQGISAVVVQFNLDQDVDIKSVDIRNQVDRIVNDLPEDAEDPTVEKFSFSQFPIMTLALSGPQDPNDLYRLADEDLEPVLSQVTGVGDVQITGGQKREVHVLLDARKLREHTIPLSAVAGAIRAANLDVPAGHITQPGREFVIRSVGRFQRVSEIAGVRVPTFGRGIVTVGDLGTVVDTHEEKRTASRFDGKATVILAIQPRSDANEVEVADGIRGVMPRLEKMLPPGAHVDVAEDTSNFIRGALSNVGTNMLIGILLTGATLFLFMKSWSSTVIVSLVMPASIIVAFIGMAACGLSLNIISLTGLAIVIGVLVNNAILILENVNRFMHEGMEPQQAAVHGSREIAIAIFSSTATNLVVFLPIAFMGEIIGRFFKELGLTVVFATTVSLLVSFSLTPMMCGLMLKQNSGKRGFWMWLSDHTFGLVSDGWRAAFGRVRGVYVLVLHWCLRHRITTLTLTVFGFLLSLVLLAMAGGEFMPPTDEGVFRVTVQAPVGTPLSVTDTAVRRVEDIVRTAPYLKGDLKHYYVRVGQVAGLLGGSSQGVNLGEVNVTVSDRSERTATIDQLVNDLRAQLVDIPSVQINVDVSHGGPAEDPVAVDITGPNLEELQAISGEVMSIVQSTPGTAGVSKSWQAGQPEVRVIPRQDEAGREGVDTSQVAQEVRGYIEGQKASQFRDRDQNYDIVVKLRDQDRAWAEDLGRMFIYSPRTAQMVQISQVADLRREAGPSLITRKDRQRLITISSKLTGEYPVSVVQGQIADAIKKLDVPEDVTVSYGGETENMQKNFREMFKAMAVATVLTFLCVAAIVESWGLAFVVMLAIPVCLVGVSLAMLIGDVTINIFSLMGIIILVGMIINNAIIILDYAIRREKDGLSAHDAVVEACDVRFRMNVMANLTTVVALIPLSLGLGFAGEIFRPLAVVQMGGIVAASVLSLLVIPVIFVSLRRRRHKADSA